MSRWKDNPLGCALTVLFIVTVFLSALTKIGDTETWLHLSLGKLIWQMKGVPDAEPFTYPILGEPFSYNSWLFGLLTYALNSHFGAYGLVLLKASVIAAAFYILLKDSLRPYGNYPIDYPIAIIVLVAAVVISQYRFVLRPDMFLMMYLGFSIFSLNAYLYDNKKYIYALPAIHLLWANMHASIIVMSVPFGAFIAGSIVHRYLGKRGVGSGKVLTDSQMKVVAIVFAVSFAATLITPYFSLHQYIYGPKYLSSGWHTHKIVEMLPPSGWARILLYGIVAAVSASFVLVGKRMSFIHLLLVIPFMVLPFTSIRFQFLIAVVGGPVLVRNASAFLENRKWNLLKTKAAAATCAVLLILYCSNAVASTVRHNQFGFGFDYSEMPRGAVKYMDSKGIYGKVFNPFHFGQYIIWTGYPRRTIFTDARGHLPGELLTTMQEARYSNPVMDGLSEKYGFEAVLLDRPRFPPEIVKIHGKVDKSFEHPDWALVYWDDNSYLYLKKEGTYVPLIKEDEYRLIKPLASFASFIRGLNDDNIAGFEQELKRNIGETGSSSAYMFLSLLYLTNDNYKEAVEAASNVQVEALKTTSYIAMGDAYKGMGNFELSLHYYKKALNRNEIPGVLLRAGGVSQIMGDNKQAIKHFERALELDSSMTEVYPKLINAYLDLGMEKEANEAMRRYQGLKQGH
jgi:hypothetical protein